MFKVNKININYYSDIVFLIYGNLQEFTIHNFINH